MRKTFARAVSVPAAALSLFLFTVQEVRAAADFGSACLIQATPFYQKLFGAGVFDIAVTTPPDEAKPVELLFRMAKGLRYSADRKSDDQWQPADKTTKYFSGDCEDKAIWLYTQLQRNGYRDASLVIGRYAPTSRVFHMWVTYREPDGGMLLLDPTIQRKPWDPGAFPEKLYKPAHILTGDDCVSL